MHTVPFLYGITPGDREPEMFRSPLIVPTHNPHTLPNGDLIVEFDLPACLCDMTLFAQVRFDSFKSSTFLPLEVLGCAARVRFSPIQAPQILDNFPRCLVSICQFFKKRPAYLEAPVRAEILDSFELAVFTQAAQEIESGNHRFPYVPMSCIKLSAEGDHTHASVTSFVALVSEFSHRPGGVRLDCLVPSWMTSFTLFASIGEPKKRFSLYALDNCGNRVKTIISTERLAEHGTTPSTAMFSGIGWYPEEFIIHNS